MPKLETARDSLCEELIMNKNKLSTERLSWMTIMASFIRLGNDLSPLMKRHKSRQTHLAEHTRLARLQRVTVYLSSFPSFPYVSEPLMLVVSKSFIMLDESF